MKIIRFIPLSIGWFLLTISVIIFWAACGFGWAGENVMKLAFVKE